MKHNVLVIGGGGREHAVVWKLRQSQQVGKIYALPGNGGISEIAECHPDIKATDIERIIEFVKAHEDIYLTVVTPDDPLALGLVNRLNELGRRAFGPTQEAAIVEYSKAFSKDFMKKYSIPTADYQTFTSFEAAVEYVKGAKHPLVIKADGLALGKGVVISFGEQESIAALEDMMVKSSFGSAGEQVVIEEFLTGYEVSFLAFTDGESIRPTLPARDFKRAFEGNKGLNTGGMGSFCPVSEFDLRLQKLAYDRIMLPTINALRAENRRFKGVLYFGLMVNGDDIRVVEYNSRFGDPETQVILPMLKTDLFEIMEAVIDERLEPLDIEWQDGAAVCVVAASGGYPKEYEKGKKITFSAGFDANAIVFHAGTTLSGGEYATSGGRVLGVTAIGENHQEARKLAYDAIEKISFDKMFFRRDIAE